MEILNHASSHINCLSRFCFRGLAVLSRNSQNINASKITRYTVQCLHVYMTLSNLLFEGFTANKYASQLCSLHRLIKCSLPPNTHLPPTHTYPSHIPHLYPSHTHTHPPTDATDVVLLKLPGQGHLLDNLEIAGLVEKSAGFIPEK